MELYEYQRSRSFIHLSHSDSIYSNVFSSINARPIEAKIHVALPWDEGMEVSSNGLDHMTKMAVLPIYGEIFKNLLRKQLADDLETGQAAYLIFDFYLVFKY